MDGYHDNARRVGVSQELRSRLPPQTLERIDALADLVRSKSFPELVKYIYENFPAYRKNSVFQT